MNKENTQMKEDETQELQQLVVFELGGEEFGVDITQVREIIRKGDFTTVPNAPSYVKGVINLRGQITTIIDLRMKLGLFNDGAIDEQQARIIIVEIDNNIMGMIVDSVSEVTYLSKKDIDSVPSTLKQSINAEYIKGVGKLPNRLLILIDLKSVLKGS
ncbi:MAG: chemotaxis protein CheW [Methanosarcinaceae archaeon]|nr:chemotaxis protein CheW [Methanosarcinaceae archaeon]